MNLFDVKNQQNVEKKKSFLSLKISYGMYYVLFIKVHIICLKLPKKGLFHNQTLLCIVNKYAKNSFYNWKWEKFYACNFKTSLKTLLTFHFERF